MNRAADGAVSSSEAGLAVLGVLSDREKVPEPIPTIALTT